MIELPSEVGQSPVELLQLSKLVRQTKAISGDVAEIGCWFGGSAVQIFNSLSPYKKFYVCDTFNGLEDVGVRDPKKWQRNSGNWFKEPELMGTFNTVQKLFHGRKKVEIIKGFFPACVGAKFDTTKFSFVHLDVDTFNSTLNCLEYFYPKMSKGGIIVLHDYFHPEIPVKEVCDMFLVNKPEKIQAILDGAKVITSQGYIIKQ